LELDVPSGDQKFIQARDCQAEALRHSLFDKGSFIGTSLTTEFDQIVEFARKIELLVQINLNRETL
jgi:hypothetical protein